MRKLKHELWPYQIRIRIHDDTAENDIFKWCNGTIGHRFMHWFSYSYDNYKLYAFKDEATLLLFKLTWGQYAIR